MAVGATRDVETWAGPATRRIDAGGRPRRPGVQRRPPALRGREPQARAGAAEGRRLARGVRPPRRGARSDAREGRVGARRDVGRPGVRAAAAAHPPGPRRADARHAGARGPLRRSHGARERPRAAARRGDPRHEGAGGRRDRARRFRRADGDPQGRGDRPRGARGAAGVARCPGAGDPRRAAARRRARPHERPGHEPGVRGRGRLRGAARGGRADPADRRRAARDAVGGPGAPRLAPRLRLAVAPPRRAQGLRRRLARLDDGLLLRAVRGRSRHARPAVRRDAADRGDAQPVDRGRSRGPPAVHPRDRRPGDLDRARPVRRRPEGERPARPPLAHRARPARRPEGLRALREARRDRLGAAVPRDRRRPVGRGTHRHRAREDDLRLPRRSSTPASASRSARTGTSPPSTRCRRSTRR